MCRRRTPRRRARCRRRPIWSAGAVLLAAARLRPISPASAGSGSSTTTWSWPTRSQRPGGDAAVVRVHGTDKAVAITTDCTPRYCKADPVEGGAQAVAEAWRNLTAAGARPLAITDCMNFGNPERPEIMGQFVGCIEGMARGLPRARLPGRLRQCLALQRDQRRRRSCRRPTIGGVGLLDRPRSAWRRSPSRARAMTIVLIGETKGHLGASLYLREIAGREDGAPPPVDLAAERRNGDFVRGQIHCRQGDRLPRRLRWRPAGRAGRDGDGREASAHRRSCRTDVAGARLAVRRGPGALRSDLPRRGQGSISSPPRKRRVFRPP